MRTPVRVEALGRLMLAVIGHQAHPTPHLLLTVLVRERRYLVLRWSIVS